MSPSLPSPARPHIVPRLGRILIVDDEERLAFAYRRFFLARGYEVEWAQSGEAALQALEEIGFDAIFSEIAIPGMDGPTLLRAVRSKYPDVPFVVLTATATIETAARALEDGALRYLVKPVTMPDLLRAADDAMTAGRAARKQRRAEQIASFHDEEEATRSERMGHIASALASVYMVYQPIMSIAARRPVAFEALARNSDPRFKNPAQLFGEAETFGLVQPLGRIIRNNVVAVAQTLVDGTRLFVNLHVSDLEDASLYDASAPLSRVAARVVLEITERGSIESVQGVEEKIRALRSLGYRIALDDIGAGYANLNSLTALEPDVVKLDMALVRNIHEHGTKQRIVGAMVNLARAMKIDLVAEGVETKDELDALMGLGCDLFQGYYFARPGPFPGQ